MEYSQDITKILYDKCGFVADNFVDATKQNMYNDLTVNREWYSELFKHFGCDLKFNKGCYYLTRRSPTRQQLESRLKDYFMWLEIIDFILSSLGIINKKAVKPGLVFTQGQLLSIVEGNSSLTRKLQNLSVFVRENTKATDTAEYLSALLLFLVNKQILDTSVYEQDENVTVYHITSVFDFFMEFVTTVSLRKKEEEGVIDVE